MIIDIDKKNNNKTFSMNVMDLVDSNPASALLVGISYNLINCFSCLQPPDVYVIKALAMITMR